MKRTHEMETPTNAYLSTTGKGTTSVVPHQQRCAFRAEVGVTIRTILYSVHTNLYHKTFLAEHSSVFRIPADVLPQH
jgi:hypothetical protein